MFENFKKKLAKTDVSVEAMRCIAAFMVIVIHTIYILPTVVDGQVMPFRSYIACVIGDAVGIFWMIAGFFMFSEKKTYSKVLKRGVVSVALPTLMLFLAAFFLYDFFVNGASFMESISHDPADFTVWWDSMLCWVAAVPEAGVAWYMFIYALVLLFWPILNAFVMNYLKDNNRNQIVFMMVTFFLFTWNYASGNRFLGFEHQGLGGLIPASIIIIWGWVIYSHRDIFRSRKLYGVLAIAAFFAVNFVRVQFHMHDLSTEVVNATTLLWNTPFALLCESSVVIACLSLVPSEPKGVLRKLIVVVGGTTLAVYLSHSMIRDALNANFGTFIYDMLYANGHAMIVNQSLTDCIYLFLNTSMLFILGMLVAFVFKAGYSLIVLVVTKVRNAVIGSGSSDTNTIINEAGNGAGSNSSDTIVKNDALVIEHDKIEAAKKSV